MATPNYAYEKRQREIAKKKEKDAKQSKRRGIRDAASTQASVPSKR